MMTRAFVIGTMLVGSLCLPVTALAQQEAPADQGKLRLAPSGYVQFDVRAFPGWEVTPGTGRLNRDDVEVRRIRAGLEGSWRRVSFEISVDPADADGIFVKDAYAQVRISRALRVRVGQFKLPGTRDYDVSARRLDFLERTPLTSSLAVGRDVGGRIDGRLGRLSYDAGLFAGDGVGRDDRADVTAAGRATWQLARRLEVGGSLSVARTTADDSDPANGATFRTASGYRFAEAVYVQGQRRRMGADLEWSPGRWRVIAEGLRLTDQRREQGLDYEDLPAAVGAGFSASLRRRLSSRTEAMFRYDYLAFDDTSDGAAAESVRPRATNIRPRSSHGATLGATWVLGRWARVLGNVAAERYTEARSAPEPGRRGWYVSLGSRLQLEWP